MVNILDESGQHGFFLVICKRRIKMKLGETGFNIAIILLVFPLKLLVVDVEEEGRYANLGGVVFFS